VRRFDGKRVLVTGGSSGIGRAVVAGFAREGAAVLAWGRDRGRLAEVAATSSTPPGAVPVRTAVVDLLEVEQVRAGVRAAVATLGGLDVLVNCAGIGIEEPVLEVTDAVWHDVLAVNLTAAFFACQEAARHMVDAGGGAIVNVASTDAFVHDAPFVHYSVSKAGLVMMTRAFAYELGHRGVRCNAVAPGATLTPMTEEALAAGDAQDALREGLRRVPLRRFARPEEQAAVVLFLASEEASYVNGATLLADGGMLQGYWYAPHREPPLS
jgi:NAD(P)-dependent dehydrogenase (short-subunit alcohol dehydrogenase family)